MKKDINDTFAGIVFDRSTLPVPAINTVSFCDDMDTSVVDDLSRDLVKITKIGIVLMVVLALLLLAGHCALEWYKWRCLKRHLQYTREAWTTDPSLFYNGSKTAPTVDLSDHNLLMLEASSQHPLLTRIANQLTARLGLSPSQHIHLQWFFHYIFHPPALACFLIGFFGLLSVQLQLIAVTPLQNHYSNQVAASVNDFSNTIATSINASMYNQSSAYAADVNGRVDLVQSTINDGLFGWVNGTTTTLNNTINDFYTELQDAVNSVFNGTILQSPVDEFIHCFIGSKVDAIENALTFLHDNLHINIPRVNDTVLVLSSDDVNEVTRPIATAAIGGDNGQGQSSQGLVGRLVGAYVKSLKQERIVFGIFMGLWGLVVLMALGVIFWHSYGRDWYEAHKRRRFQKKHRAGIEGLVVPFRDPATRSAAQFDLTRGGNGVVVDEKGADLPSFGPMAPPKPSFLTTLRSPTFRAPPRHPLSDRNPEYEKSWDSFLDQANAGDSAAPAPDTKRSLKISAPMKLMAVGKLKRTAERPVDAQALNGEGSGESQSKPTLLQRATSLWKKTPASEGEVDDHAGPSQKHRPNLTISVSHATDDSQLADVGVGEQVAPGSAWSVSPGPAPKMSWMQGCRPKSRRSTSVPDVARDSYQLPLPPQPEMRFAVPLHHGFERTNAPIIPPMISPVFGNTESQNQNKSAFLEPPPRHPRRRGEPQPKRLTLTIANPDTSVPVTQLMTTTHARRSSQAVDPFVTPFDDENQPSSPVSAAPAAHAGLRQSTATNPFIALAI